MAEKKLHPFDMDPSTSPSKIMSTLPSPLVGSVSFHETTGNRESLGSSNSPNPGTTSILRNRNDSKPTSVAALDPGALAQTNVNTCSNASSTGATRSSLTRRISGPGGRFLTDGDDEETPRWTSRLSKYLRNLYSQYSPSLTLENKGSIARDHLANERTYLAWLRTSLSLITVGVAVTQLFRLQPSGPNNGDQLIKVSEIGRPLGGTFIALGILFLWLGTSRYFHSQSVLSYGQFPASRGSVVIATVCVLALLIACFIVVLHQKSQI